MKWLQKTALVTAGISVLAVSRVAAQGAIVPAPIVPSAPQTDALNPERKITSVIRLRSVKPTLMAFWLDPKNHAAPPLSAFPNQEKSPSSAKAPIQLPAGVDRIVPLDVQNALLVFGTEEGVRSLQEIINFLDRPMPQIEVEARFISIQSASLAGIWADLAAKARDNRPAMGLIGGDYENQLTELLLRNQARSMTLKRSRFNNQNTQIFSFAPSSIDDYISPRLTIPNRPPGNFSSPMPVIPPPKGTAPMPGMLGRINPQVPSALKPFEKLRLEVSPTINYDGSVTLGVESSGLSDVNLQSLAIVRDDQTLAFALPMAAGAPNHAFLLLRPRLVRRAEGFSPTP